MQGFLRHATFLRICFVKNENLNCFNSHENEEKIGEGGGGGGGEGDFL